MSTAARRRLMRDFRRLQEDPPMGVSGAPGENNIMIWNAVIFGKLYINPMTKFYLTNKILVVHICTFRITSYFHFFYTTSHDLRNVSMGQELHKPDFSRSEHRRIFWKIEILPTLGEAI